MAETFDETGQEKQEPFDAKRLADVVERRHMLFLIPCLVGWFAISGAAWVIPARYKSTTLILVQQPSMPQNYVMPNVNDNLQERLQSITQQILSRTRLLLIIDEMHLYEGGRRELTPDDKVDRMRKDIAIELVRDPKTEGISAFKVNYSAPGPAIAQQVTGKLTHLFINANLEVRQQQSQDTTDFIRRQLATAQSSLAEQERKVREFESAHQGELPSQEASNLQILGGLQQQLQNEQDGLSAAKQQGAYLQSMIDQQTTAQGMLGAHAADGQPTGLAALDQQLQTLRAKLAALRSRYTDEYPEVQATRDEIVRTEKLREEYLASAKNRAASAPGKAAVATAADLQPGNLPLLQMQSQLDSNRIEIANREQAIARVTAKIEQYQARLNRQPAAEQELADLTRGYTQSKQIYDDLLKKENESSMATSMEHMQQGEHFVMLDPPSLPLKPDFPNRMKFCEIGLGVGCLLGLGMVVLAEFLDDRLYRDAEIRKSLPVAVLAEVPEIVTPQDLSRRRWRSIRGWATAAVVLGAIVAGSAYTYIRD